ncbi:hypothetical protein MYBA111488_24715 [Mycobacterium basiliense]
MWAGFDEYSITLLCGCVYGLFELYGLAQVGKPIPGVEFGGVEWLAGYGGDQFDLARLWCDAI